MPWYGNANPATPVPKGPLPETGAQPNGTPGGTNANGTQGFGQAAPEGPSYVPDQNLWGSHLDYGENHIDTSPYAGRDPSNFWNLPQYGGSFGLSNKIAAGYGQQGDEYANRQISNSLSNPYRMQQGATRGLQQGAYQQQLLASQGGVPSSALIGQGMALDANQQAATRAMALGGSSGAMRGAGAGSLQAIGAGASGRAGEIAQANQGLLGQASGIRQGDFGAFGIDNQREMQQAELNQKMQLASQGMGNQILLDQLGVDTQGYGARLGYQTADQLAAADRAYKTQQELINGGVQAASGLLSAYGQQQGRGNAGSGGGGGGF